MKLENRMKETITNRFKHYIGCDWSRAESIAVLASDFKMTEDQIEAIIYKWG